MNKFEVSVAKGEAEPDQEAALRAGMAALLSEESDLRKVSAWKMTGRASASRSGMLDYRNRLGKKAWPAARWLAFTGQAYNGRQGRGETK